MSSESEEGRADQEQCTEIVVDEIPDAAIVSNLGVVLFILAGVGDWELNFYPWNSMRLATPIGLGLAKTTDRPVTVLDGDGSTLMQMGAWATVADQGPPNLTIVIWDNHAYGTTGGQPTLSTTTDFTTIAEGVGLTTYHAASTAEFEELYPKPVTDDGAAVIVCEVEPIDPEACPPLDYAHIKRWFRTALRLTRYGS